MKDGAEATEIDRVVKCGGFDKLMTIETCKQACDHFGGIHEEPVKGHDADKNMVVVGYNYYIQCLRSRLLPFQAAGEVLPKIKGKEA
jgi:hypothetical protein